MSEPRLVVFDVDGTLIDSQQLILAAMGRAFAAIGRPAPTRDAVLAIVGLSLPEALAILAPQLSPGDAARLADGYRAGFKAGAEGSAPLYPGARAALERLAARPDTLLGVATGKGRRGLEQVLAAHALAPFFATAQTSDGHPSKPHPSMLLQALAETGCAAGRAVMVGDTEFDVAMGRAAGLATVGVTWGYHPRERLEAAGADRVIERFADLDAALRALEAR